MGQKHTLHSSQCIIITHNTQCPSTSLAWSKKKIIILHNVSLRSLYSMSVFLTQNWDIAFHSVLKLAITDNRVEFFLSFYLSFCLL